MINRTTQSAIEMSPKTDSERTWNMSSSAGCETKYVLCTVFMKYGYVFTVYF